MTINYVPNDPRASAFARPRAQAPRPERPKNRATLDFGTLPAQQAYPPGSADALAWQSREAALAAIETFEQVHGPVTHWARSSNRKRLALLRDDGEDINAYYDGDSVRFFHHRVGTRTVYTGASTDVVAHELGHALLDTIRPPLWDSNYPEAAAFHEAFGDCTALLTALADADIRSAAVKLVGRRNFVETLGEQLSWAVLRVIGAQNNASKPRQARNRLRWALPSTLPATGPGGALINEPHSFGQVFLGCFYDVIALAFARSAAQDEAALQQAAGAAAQALYAAAKAAPITPRFFQAIGRAMAAHATSADGALRANVIEAFANHGIVVGAEPLATPNAAVAGRKLKRAAPSAPALLPATVADLRARLHTAPGAPLRVRGIDLGGQRLVEASHHRRVDLSGLADYLDGVCAMASEAVLVAPVRGALALMSHVPDASATENEVRAFVAGLVERDEIATEGKSRKRGQRRTAAATEPPASRAAGPMSTPTHAIVRRGGDTVLQRVRFMCGDCRRE